MYCGSFALCASSGEGDSGKCVFFSTFGEALSQVKFCLIGREEFLHLLTRYPSISLKLLEEFSHRMAELKQQAVSNMNESAMARLVKYLLNLSEAQEKDSVTMPLSLRELSSYLNTTPDKEKLKMTAL